VFSFSKIKKRDAVWRLLRKRCPPPASPMNNVGSLKMMRFQPQAVDGFAL
jgi:hypothetical protein